MSAGAIGGASSASSAATPNRFAEMGSDEFIKVMLAEMSNQDPLEPTDTTAILEQLSSLRNIESQTQLQERLESLVAQNELAAAAGMIGKIVRGMTEGNDTVEGRVQSIHVRDERAYLKLDTGDELRIDRVTDITEWPAIG